MGFAQKLAAAQGVPPAGSSFQPPQQGGQKAGTQYPPQQGYQAYNPGNTGPPQGNYGGQQYAAPQPQRAGPQEIAGYKALLQQQIQEKGLQPFYPPNSPALDQIANRAPQQVAQICQQWRIPMEVGRDICKLGLYDIIIFIDDSGSMQFEENGERIKDLHVILERVAYAATLFDDDGISLRTMNGNFARDNVRSQAEIGEIMRNVKFSKTTPLGSQLRKKVIDDIILRNAQNRSLTKPVLIMTITDGVPMGEFLGTNQDCIFDTIRYGVDQLRRFNLGPAPVSFQFAQVGSDSAATAFLSKLDNDPRVGGLVDCTSNYETESAELASQTPPVDLTPELWLVKLLLGAIDASYDSQDEQGSGRPQQQQGYVAPQVQQGYGAPPPQGYAPPQGPPPNYQQPNQYGQPPPQGYYSGNQQSYAPPIPYGKPGQGPQYQQPPPPPRY